MKESENENHNLKGKNMKISLQQQPQQQMPQQSTGIQLTMFIYEEISGVPKVSFYILYFIFYYIYKICLISYHYQL